MPATSSFVLTRAPQKHQTISSHKSPTTPLNVQPQVRTRHGGGIMMRSPLNSNSANPARPQKNGKYSLDRVDQLDRASKVIGLSLLGIAKDLESLVDLVISKHPCGIFMDFSGKTMQKDGLDMTRQKLPQKDPNRTIEIWLGNWKL